MERAHVWRDVWGVGEEVERMSWSEFRRVASIIACQTEAQREVVVQMSFGEEAE